MKLNSIERIESALLEGLYFGEAKEDLGEKCARYLSAFLKAYPLDVFASLTERQLMLLYVVLQKDRENTDHLSFSICWPRRSVINSANGLVRRGLCYWDQPTASNMDAGNDLTIDRDKIIDREVLRVR